MMFSLDGPCNLELGSAFSPDGAIPAYFGKELADAVGEANVFLTIDASIGHRPSEVFGVSGGVLSDGRFVVPDGAGHWCSFDPKSLTIAADLRVTVALCCESFKATVLLDWILLPVAQYAHAAVGLAPVHASAASLERDGAPVVFSAWSGVGKTNIVLYAVGHGGDYYGDDRVAVGVDGTILPSTRKVSIYGYNRSLVPDLSARARRRLLLGDSLHRQARRLGGRVGFLLSYAANGFGSTRAGATELGGRPGRGRVMPRAHVVCFGSREIASLAPRLDPLEDVDVRRMARAHVAVMEYEFIWFQRYVQTWRWAMNQEGNPWTSLTTKWEENLAEYFAHVSEVYALRVPLGSPAEVAPQVWDAISERITP